MKNYTFPESIDLSRAILWQYNSAVRLQSIVKMLQALAEQSSVSLWKKIFYAFNLDRPISESDSDYYERIHGLMALSVLFGIERPRWTSGGLSSLVRPNTWRRYLKGMIWLMDSDGSCADINKWLKIVFPDIIASVSDNFNMTITYRFNPLPANDSDEWQLIHIDGFLPHPAGVKAIVSLFNEDSIFGFEGQNLGQLNNARLHDETEGVS